MKVSKVLTAILFLFAPARFNKAAVQYHEQYVEEIKKRYGGASTPFDRQESSRNNQNQVILLRASLRRSLVHVFLSLVAAVISAFMAIKIFGTISPIFSIVLQMLGVFMLLGATLWQIGEAASLSGQWLAEIIHNFFFVYCMILALT
jgi:vacuolar-type H+-ATPase subunit I/STV1